MSELDMYNIDDDEEDDEDSLTIINEKSLVIQTDEHQPSRWHPLSNYNPDRHQRRKIRQNIDPNIRL